MIGSRRLVRLELDLPQGAEDGRASGASAAFAWPTASGEPPASLEGVEVSIDGDTLRLRVPGASLDGASALREVRGARVLLSWEAREAESAGESAVSAPSAPEESGEALRPGAGGAHGVVSALASAVWAELPHVELKVDGRPVRRFALPLTAGARVTFGARSKRADVSIDDSLAMGVVGRITYDGKDYRADSQDSAAMAQLNGADIFWPVPLVHSDEIMIGGSTVRFLRAAPSGPLEKIEPPAEVAEAAPRKSRPGVFARAKAVLVPALVVGSAAAAVTLMVVFACIKLFGRPTP